VVLDEVETLLMMWKGDLGHLHFDMNWMRFKEVLRSAKKVYVMDAFMGEKTTNFLKSLSSGDEPLRIIMGREKPEQRRLVTYSCRESWISQITSDLKAGRKLFVFYPFKVGDTKHYSMEKFVHILMQDSGLPASQFISYNSDSPDSVKKTLRKVNDVWSTKSCIVCNTCITVGVNFDELHFDRVYAMWKTFVSQRDFFQNMYRCRKLKTNEVHLYTEKPKRILNPWIHSDNSDPVYQGLLADISLEENSKGSMDVFKLFAKQSGFVFHGNGLEVSQAVRERILKLADATECIFRWCRISRMTPDEYEEAKQSIINSCTFKIDTVVKVHKYDFIKLFKSDTDDEIMGELWDTHKFRLFDAIRSQECGGLRPADILIRDLFAQNNCKYFLPEDPKWTYTLANVRTVFNTKCGGEEHRCNQELMSHVLEAYFSFKVWSSGFKKVWKHDPTNHKRKYILYKTNPEFEYLTDLFLCHMVKEHTPDLDIDLESSCLVTDDN